MSLKNTIVQILIKTVPKLFRKDSSFIKRFILISFIYSSIVVNVFGQQAFVSGLVSDSSTMQSLPGVNVVAGPQIGVSTNINGEYALELAPGKYELRFSYIGYDSKTTSITLSDGESIGLDVQLKSKSVDLEMAVVTAGRYEQKLSDVSVSITVMKPAFIENINTTNIGQTLNYVPGLDVMDGQASIRGGSGYSYGTGSRVLVLVDDLPILTASDEDVKWNFLPVENVDQVEILKGASSALYGSSALNGIINLRTLWPGPEAQTKINLYSGIYTKPQRDELSWWWDTNPFFGGANFTHAQTFGQVDLVFGGDGFVDPGYREYNFEERIRGNIKFRHRLKNIDGFSYGLNTNLQWQHKSDFFIWVDADSGAYQQVEEVVTPNKGIRLNIDPWVSFHDNKNNKHDLRTRFYRVTNEFENDPDKANASNLYYGEYQYNKLFNNKLNWTVGLSGLYGQTKAELYGDHTNSTISIFTQLDYKFFQRLSVSLGLRWVRYTIDDTDEESGAVLRAGINYQATASTFIRASFGQGYRFPSIAEKYTATSLGSINIFPNPQLESETGWSSEVGLKQGFVISNWTGFIDFAAYWTEYENMIEFTFGVYKPDSVDIPGLEHVGFKSLNIGKARISGLEIGVTGNGSFGKVPVNLFVGYTYMNPVDLSSDTLTNDILKYRYRHSVKGDIEFNYKRMSTGLSLIYRSFMERIDAAFEEEILGQEIFPGLKDYRLENNTGAVIIDFRVAYQLTPSTRLSLLVKNLFNEEYMGRPGDLHPPRNFTIQALIRL